MEAIFSLVTFSGNSANASLYSGHYGVPIALSVFWSCAELVDGSLGSDLGISSVHPREVKVFSNTMVMRILREIILLHPHVKVPVPLKDLNTILAALMAPPFESLSTCFLSFLCRKTAFLVSVKSERRVCKLQVTEPSYMKFFKDKVALWPHPKVVSKTV